MDKKQLISNRGSTVTNNRLNDRCSMSGSMRSLPKSRYSVLRPKSMEPHSRKASDTSDTLAKISPAENSSVRLTHSASKKLSDQTTNQPSSPESCWKQRVAVANSIETKPFKNGKSKFYEQEVQVRASVLERKILVGGTKGRNLLLRFLDLNSFESKKKKFQLPDMIKGGSVRYKDCLYVFGGKLGHIISDSVFQINLNDPVEPQGPFMALARKKYSFGFASTEKGIVYLFGGKNERGEVIDDIEVIDLERRTTSLIGKLGTPKFGVSVLYVHQDKHINRQARLYSEDSISTDGQKTNYLNSCASEMQLSIPVNDDFYSGDRLQESQIERLKANSSVSLLGLTPDFGSLKPSIPEKIEEEEGRFTLDVKFDQFYVNRDTVAVSQIGVEKSVVPAEQIQKKWPKKQDNQNFLTFRQIKVKDSKIELCKNSVQINQEGKHRRPNNFAPQPMAKRPSKSSQSKWKSLKPTDLEKSRFVQEANKGFPNTKAAIWSKIYDKITLKKTDNRAIPGGVFYILGGASKNGTFFSDIEIFSPADNKLVRCGQMTESRVFAWTVKDEGAILSFGGKSEKGILNSIEKFEGGCSFAYGQMEQGRYAFKGLRIAGGFLALSGKTRKGITSKAEFLGRSGGLLVSLKQIKSCENIAFFDLIE